MRSSEGGGVSPDNAALARAEGSRRTMPPSAVDVDCMRFTCVHDIHIAIK